MTLSELIRRELAQSSEPDPQVIARRLLARLSKDHRQEVLVRGIAELVEKEIHFARMDRGRRPRTSGRVCGPSRWSVAAGERVWCGAWKMLDDCGLEDLRSIAVDYRNRSQQMEAKAREFDGLADDLERSGCATVGEMRVRASSKAPA